MGPVYRHGGRRTLVLASLPQCCVVCRGARSMTDADGQVQCPHCVTGLPVVHLPLRRDTPRGATA